ncbi:hypothetical protein [Ensifer sp. YR511]|uniref:hypothetical protein n=1 Tax=Ensifer sp. YR511 TaxID=1855294 RepID=UPI000880C3F1|nr:hypothetical protein [Ensifer sp. YR511]SDN84080.1 hypothetical protein SAMN05216328_13915 [Ensifer sp. YR511]
MSSVTVRVYIVQPDSELQLLLEADTDYFGGSIPSEGDVFSFFRDARHFRVERRQFLPSKERDRGWALMCSEVTEAIYTNVAVTWALDSDWATEIELKLIEEHAREARRQLKLTTKKASKID